jgi:tellurite resistance protein
LNRFMSSHLRQRIPLNTLAIGFGVAGLAQLWTVAGSALGIDWRVGQSMWIVAAVVWVGLMTAHVVRGFQSSTSLMTQLRHPVQGPIAALFIIVPMLLGEDLYRFVPVAGTVIVVAAVALETLFATWLMSLWIGGGFRAESMHGAYFLPMVAGGLIAASALHVVGLPDAAMAAFGVGMLFWVVIFAILIARLAAIEPLPDALTPTIAILAAPPAVGGLAWFAMNGGVVDQFAHALLGLAILMVLVQLALLPRYSRLTFSLGFWSFTFTFAAIGTYGVVWLSVLEPAGWQVGVAMIVVVATALIAWVAVRSILLVTTRADGTAKAEAQLQRADDAAAL